MSIFNNNSFNPFGTNNLFDEINKTNQQINSMNLPQPKPQNPYRQQNIGNMLLAFSDVVKGRDPSAGVMQRKTMLDAQKKEAERKADIETFLKNNPQFKQAYELKNMLGIDMPSAKDKTTFERFGVYDSTGLLVDSVNKGDLQKINEIQNDPSLVIGQLRSRNISNNNQSMELYSITDGDGNRIRTIADPTKKDIDDLNESGYLLNKLPTPTDRGKGPSSDTDTEYDNIKGRFMATSRLVNNLTNLANQYYENPESALAVGNAAQFVDSVVKNVDAAGNILSGEKYKNVKNSGYTTLQGKDYSNQITQVSQSTGVSESRVRDLAYLFAAARGQEGRGLSDKDYENALKIVSGGVGAEGKIKVLEDVAKRVDNEVKSDLDFIVRNLPSETEIDKYQKLRGSLPPFNNPYQNNTDPLGIR